MPPGASEALKHAEATIGNRLLKTDPDYVASSGHNTQLRVCLTRKEIYENKRAFNEQVLELRQHKLLLVERTQKMRDRLGEIRVEIPHKAVRLPPELPRVDDELEFPEKNLEIKPVVTSTRSRTTTVRRTMTERRKSAAYPQPRIRQPRVPRFIPLIESRPLTATWELLKSKDQVSTPFETEIRERRIARHLYEQDMLIADATVAVHEFDSRLRQLQRERIRVQERNQLLELHLHQLHREMNVLNRFEAQEDRLAERVYNKLMQVKGVEEQIEDCKTRIEEHVAEKGNLDLSCQELQRQFKKLVQEHKFADFLRRIFKKKYRPPKDHDDDDESSESESSSSSSEEEDLGSLDSRDIGPIRLDPNICPEGCDQETYDQTYELRNNRHRYEQEMLEKDHLVELLRKDIDLHEKMKRKLSMQLDTRKNELKEFMMEKQSCMNDVDQVVVLRYDQIRASALRGEGLSETVVFPEQILGKLRRRVYEIQEEIRQQNERQKINRTHLFRMNIDLRAMEAQAEELRAQMRDVLTRKLGKPRRVDRTLDDTLRQLARRHKFSAALATSPEIFQQLRQWRERHSDLEKKYLEALNNHSENLRLAAALQADTSPQKPHRDPAKMVGGYTLSDYRRDVVRLQIVRSRQVQQIMTLRQEIQSLQMKPFTQTTPVPSMSQPSSELSEIQLLQGLGPLARTQRRYFPITPLGSRTEIVLEVNIMKMLYDCLDNMRVSRDEARELLKDITDELFCIVSGEKRRYDVVDSLVRKWLLKYGGDPSLYKKQTKAFDAVADLVDRLLRDQVQVMEPISDEQQLAASTLESALKAVADQERPLHERLGQALATLFHARATSDAEMDSIEIMTSLVNSLIDEEHPVTLKAIERIQISDVIQDIKECGIQKSTEELERVVLLAIECLRMQLVDPVEAEELRVEITKAMATDAQVKMMLEEHTSQDLVTKEDRM